MSRVQWRRGNQKVSYPQSKFSLDGGSLQQKKNVGRKKNNVWICEKAPLVQHGAVCVGLKKQIQYFVCLQENNKYDIKYV